MLKESARLNFKGAMTWNLNLAKQDKLFDYLHHSIRVSALFKIYLSTHARTCLPTKAAVLLDPQSASAWARRGLDLCLNISLIIRETTCTWEDQYWTTR